jgi:hypothetical protein
VSVNAIPMVINQHVFLVAARSHRGNPPPLRPREKSRPESYLTGDEISHGNISMFRIIAGRKRRLTDRASYATAGSIVTLKDSRDMSRADP